jgi:hypothetical protein
VVLDADDLVDHHFHVNGPTAILNGDLIEDNRNEDAIAVWIGKHNRYAVLQAREEIAEAPIDRRPDPRVWLARRAHAMAQAHLHAVAAICACRASYFIYRYLFRLGFLDGEGLRYLSFPAGVLVHRLLVDINRDELRQ